MKTSNEEYLKLASSATVHGNKKLPKSGYLVTSYNKRGVRESNLKTAHVYRTYYNRFPYYWIGSGNHYEKFIVMTYQRAIVTKKVFQQLNMYKIVRNGIKVI
jgi:hypothetical protein